MANDFDPVPQSGTQQQAPTPQTADQGGLASDWRDWIGKPANKAALMQFGVAMLQPVGMGETGLSHAANSLAYGGEAAHRVAETEATRAGEASLADYREKTAGAREDVAAARQQDADTKAANPPGSTAGLNSVMRARLARDRAFNQWAQKPEDNTGLSTDPVVSALGAKSKGQILADPILMQRARKIFDGMPSEDPLAETGGGAPEVDNRPLSERRAAPFSSNPSETITLNNARAAIAAGRSQAAVAGQLQKMGIDPSRL